MLRAMMEALQAHAAAHSGEPFDHERHMPQSMREARDDPATWAAASAGAGSSGAGRADGGGMSEAAKEAVVAELRGLTKFKEVAGSIVKLNVLIGKGSEGHISKACLLLLGTEKEVSNATKPRTPIPTYFLDNLTACIVVAWPNCSVKDNGSTNKTIPGHPGLKYSGHYVDGLKFAA
jgi:hypothetical protein